MKNKTYCIFSAQYLPHLGGVERYTNNLGKKLVENGNKVVVVTSNTEKLQNKEEMDNILVYRMPCFNLLNGRFPILRFGKEGNNLYKELLSMEIDEVIINTRFYIHSYFGVKYAKKKKIKPILIEHGTDHFTVNNKILDWFGALYEHGITWAIKRKCDNFYGVSKACSNWLRHFGIMSKGELYNAVDTNHINQIIRNVKRTIRDEYKLEKESIIITYAGRLVKEKGVQKLITAFLRVRENYPNLDLFIAGDGDLYDELKQINNSNIHILGKVPFEQVVRLMKDSDIFVLPTDYPEGFPTSVLEAVACNCFVITTEAGGSKELIINHDYGIVMKDNTVDELIETLSEAILNWEYREKAVKLSYSRLLGYFTWNVITNKVEEVCNKK